MLPTLLLVAVTVVWGYTFVPVKDAVALYPLFAFLGVRFLISTAVLSVPAAVRLRRLGRDGWRAGIVLGILVAAAYALQTEGLRRTTVSSAGFITGLYVVLTPLFGLALFRHRIGLASWAGVGLALAGLGLLSGSPGGGNAVGDLLVFGCAATTALQILLVGRYAPHHDAVALTFVQMAVCAVAFLAIAGALGDLSLPHGRTVWSALIVTALFAGALGFVLQIWVQRRISPTRAAILFTLETPFAALFGAWLKSDRLGPLGWAGGALILLGIGLAEPAFLAGAGRLVRTARELAPRRA